MAAARKRLPADLGLLLVAIGAVGFGCRPLFARLAFADGVSPALAGFLTLAPTALLCLPLALPGTRRQPPPGSAVLWALFAGAFVAAGNLAYMHALEALPVATATLIYFAYPLFVILLGWLLIGIRLSARLLAAVGLIVLGCGAIVAPGGARSPVSDLGPILVCFVAPLSYALLLVLLSRRLVVLPLILRIALITLGATLVLLPAGGLDAFTVFETLGPTGWLGAAGLVLVCGFLPQLTTTIGAPLAGADRAAIIGGLELLTALATGWALLGEPVAAREVAGAVLIGGAILLARRAAA